MSLRLYVGPSLHGDGDGSGHGSGLDLAAFGPGAEFDLPAAAARHAQVRRVQPGDVVVLFDGRDGLDVRDGHRGVDCSARSGDHRVVHDIGHREAAVDAREWAATIVAMGRSAVRVALGPAQPVARELGRAVTLAVGMPANERMDALIEKATELGVAGIQPLLCERAVLRLEGERAERRRQHWQGVAIAAAEQCGRVRVPVIAPVRSFSAWLAGERAAGQAQRAAAPSPLRSAAGGEAGAKAAVSVPPPLRLLLSPAPGVAPLAQRLAAATASQPVLTLSGPEGGLSPAESAAAVAAGFVPASLGPRVLRADTAPLVVLVAVALVEGGG